MVRLLLVLVLSSIPQALAPNQGASDKANRLAQAENDDARQSGDFVKRRFAIVANLASCVDSDNQFSYKRGADDATPAHAERIDWR